MAVFPTFILNFQKSATRSRAHGVVQVAFDADLAREGFAERCASSPPAAQTQQIRLVDKYFSFAFQVCDKERMLFTFICFLEDVDFDTFKRKKKTVIECGG